MQKRCEWRGITLQIEKINHPGDIKKQGCDLFMIGGGSDREQAIATTRLTLLAREMKEWIEDGVSGLTICGGYQFLGEYYQTKSGKKLKGMGIFPFYTIAGDDRLMTNVLVDSDQFGQVVGFENHAGRTYHDLPTIGKVVNGYGNNDESNEEGLHYHHLIGTYLHGPILPKNPAIADYLIEKAYERKTGKELEPLDNQLENKANQTVWDRFRYTKRTKYNNDV